MPASQVKVLVVDDQPLIVEELCEFLESSGYHCVPCVSSTEAIQHFTADSAIGLMVCDLHMPECDGIQLLLELKKVAEQQEQRLFEAIMLTGRADKQDVIKALRAGFADYYQKPVNLNELLAGLQRQETLLLAHHKGYQHLGHLNQKLKYLAESIDDLYQDLDKARSHSPAKDHAGEPATQESDTIPTIFAPLSPRQLDVARLVGKGKTNYQIACELGITENTVKLYVSQVLRLTHMHNRTQLALALSPGSPGARQRVTEH